MIRSDVLSVVVALAGAIFPGWSQDNPVFPVVGIGPGQWLRLHAIALGAGQGRCRARLSFRNAANEDLGRALDVDLTLGKSALIDYEAAERIEVRAVVEHQSNPSSCFTAIELMDSTGSRSYLASMMRPAARPADYPFPAFVDVGAGEDVRVVVS